MPGFIGHLFLQWIPAFTGMRTESHLDEEEVFVISFQWGEIFVIHFDEGEILL